MTLTIRDIDENYMWSLMEIFLNFVIIINLFSVFLHEIKKKKKL